VNGSPPIASAFAGFMAAIEDEARDASLESTPDLTDSTCSG
jgi:hypothetical protein